MPGKQEEPKGRTSYLSLEISCVDDRSTPMLDEFATLVAPSAPVTSREIAKTALRRTSRPHRSGITTPGSSGRDRRIMWFNNSQPFPHSLPGCPAHGGCHEAARSFRRDADGARPAAEH